MNFPVPLSRYIDSRREWLARSDLPFAKTCGGSRLHYPDCAVIESNIRTSEEVIAWLEGRGPEPRGNVTYPVRAEGASATCRYCVQRIPAPVPHPSRLVETEADDPLYYDLFDAYASAGLGEIDAHTLAEQGCAITRRLIGDDARRSGW